jgi:hypothetical protein
MSLFGIILSTFIGCSDIFEEDISAETPVMILPITNDTIYSNNVHFKWNEMKGASFYNLQIVKPSFAEIDAFILDTLISAEQFYQILPPGDYQFQLRGENGGYVSMYAGPYSFYIDSVLDLASQYVSLNTPEDNVYINGNDDLVVTWQNLYAADYYDFILKKGAEFTVASISDQAFDLNSLTYTISSSFFDVEGTYFWGIRGANIIGNSPYSSRQINVDKTNPNNPELLLPIDETVQPIADPVTFKWLKGTDPGTVHATVTSTLEISSTPSFIIYSEFTDLPTDSLVYTFPTTGDFWWRVKLVDEVGNESELYSPAYLITLE